MASGIQETDMQWQSGMKALAVVREHIKGITEEVTVFLTVPSPSGIRVRVMAVAGTGGSPIGANLREKYI